MKPSLPLVWAIRQYQRFLSPMLPAMCRFHPTCSHYAVEALQVHGLGRGSMLATWRLLRCHPLNPGGYDPVPPRHPALAAAAQEETATRRDAAAQGDTVSQGDEDRG